MEIWKRQRKILTAFGIFLGLMALCTLISRAVYASGLPQVTVEKPRRMAIGHTVEAEGIVSQGREYAVTTLAGLRVRTVYTHVGERVTPETLLFDLDMDDLEEKIQEQELAVKTLQLKIADMEQNQSLNAQKQQTESARAQEDYDRTAAETAAVLDRAKDDLDDAEDALEEHRENEVSVTSEEDRKKAREEYEEWVGKEAELKSIMEDAKAEYEAAEEALKALEEKETQQNETEQNDIAETEEGQGDTAAASADTELEEARGRAEAAKEAYELAQSEYQSHISDPVPEPDFSGEDQQKASWDAKKETLKEAVDAAERAVEDAEQAESDALLEAGRKVADANGTDAADSSLEISRLELAAMQRTLADYKKIREADGQVYPEADGIITRIQVSSGERAPDGAAVVYADLSSPLQFQVSLTKDQKKYVAQGDTATLSLGGSSEEVTVDYVAENEMNPELYDIYVFLSDGVGTIGQSGTFQAEVQSETYSCCIPIEALHEDTNRRSFVYVVSERSGILGTELAAELVYVTVLDQNEKYAAIEEGVIDSSTELITWSTETLEDRAVIRYKE